MGLDLLSQKNDAAKHVFSTCELKMSTQQGEQHCYSNYLIFLHRTKLNPVARDGKQEYIRRALNLILANNMRPV